jgi:ABC-2 type transport system permease protein
VIRLCLAFLRRDFLIWSSYRLAAVWQALGVAILVGVAYFVGTAFGGAGPTAGDTRAYLAFVLSGIAFTDFFANGIHAVSQSIGDNQKSGTLEPMLLTPVGGLRLAVGSALFKMAIAAARMTIYLALGVLVFGFWRTADAASGLFVFVPATISFVALGILAAAFVVLVKQADPVLLAYAWITGILGGVLFPVAVLPAWVQPLSAVVPLTHALAGMRAALDGAPPSAVRGQATVLTIMAAVLLPLGVAGFNWAVARAKQEGSLAQY